MMTAESSDTPGCVAVTGLQGVKSAPLDFPRNLIHPTKGREARPATMNDISVIQSCLNRSLNKACSRG